MNIGKVAATGENIADHAYEKHVVREGEFGDITRNDFKEKVQETMTSPTQVRNLSNGRTAYWSDSEKMIV